MAKHPASAQTNAQRKVWRAVFKNGIYRGGDFKASKSFCFQGVNRLVWQLNTNNMLAGSNAWWIWLDSVVTMNRRRQEQADEASKQDRDAIIESL